jgi:protein TonB
MKLAVLVLIVAVSLQPQEILSQTPPKVTHSAKPEYTREALDAKLEGVVILSCVVGADGVVSDIDVRRGLGMGLDEKAVECLRKWRFKPAMNHGEPVPAKTTIEINFRLPH